MQEIRQPSHEHTQFDAMCAEVDDFEPLPEPDAAMTAGLDEQESALDGQILGGLVTPS